MRRRTLALGLALILLASCTKVSTSQSGGERNAFTHPHELRMASLQDLTSLNQLLASDVVLGWLSQLTMAYLLRYDHANQPVPELALAVPSLANGGIGKDRKTITYHLRKGVRWSDGAPFTAADVVFTTHVILDPKTNVISRDGWDRIVNVEAPDPYTVVFHLRETFSPFLSTFFASGGSTPILPKHLLEHSSNVNTDPYNSLPVGIGPFKYVRWQRSDRIELAANPLYWRGLPKLQKIVYRIIPNRDTILAALQTGDVDMWPLAAFAYVPRLEDVPGVKLVRVPSYGFGHLDFNVTHPAVSDPAVRRALLLAFDRRAQLAKVSHSVGILQDAVLSPASPFYDSNLGFTEYDVVKANALLDAAGWKRGSDGIRQKNGVRLNLDLVSNSGSPDTDTRIELIRESWKKIGVSFVRKNVDPSLLLAPYANGGIIQTGRFDAVFFAWYTGPSGDLSNLYDCAQVPPKGQNDLRWCNARADAAMRDFKATYDAGRQKQDDDVVQTELVREVPTIVSAVYQDIYACNSDLQNFRPNQVSMFDDMMNVDI
ncbi:MAG: peptide ABC transporter substrate-binding protein [Vulcanimicrobiaceae bacterium]